MSAVNTSSRTGNVANIVNRMSQSNFNPRPDITLRRNQSEKKKIYKARFSYDAAENDELTFDEGALIEGIEKKEEGWMKGKLLQNGKVGMFPLNFVELIEESEKEVEKKKESVTSNNYEEKSTNSNIRPSNKRLSNNGPPVDLYANIPIPEKSGKERAKVLYKYEAEQSDELSLDSGVIVNIIRKQVQDDGWIEIEFNGKTGLFPENFIKILTPADDKPIAVANQPPTPPPVKPKPSTPSGTVPPIVSDPNAAALSSALTSSTPSTTVEPMSSSTTSSKIKELQQQVFAGRQPPVPGSKPQIRPKTVVGSLDLMEKNEISENIDRPCVDMKITSHPTRDRPRQGGKRPPSMYPGTVSDETNSATTNFPVKESTPPVTVTKPALVPKVEQETIKQSTKVISQETVIVPTKKSGIVNSVSSTSSIQSSSSVIKQEDESEFVSRKEFNQLRRKVDQLQQQLNELLNKSKT